MSAFFTDAEQETFSSVKPLPPLPLVGDSIARIDFETRSKCNLKLYGAFRYAQDPSTSVLCLAYQLPDMHSPTIWHPWLSEAPIDLWEWVVSGGRVESHNAEFEFCIWNYVCVKLYSWPRLSYTQLVCSAAKAAALSLPRKLDQLGPALDLPVVKDKEGHRLMLKMSKPRRPTKNDKSEWHEKFDEFERLFEYCETDVITESLASQKMKPLSEKEQKLWELTLKINKRGIYCDLELCKTAIEFAAQREKELTQELIEITDSVVTTPSQRDRILAFVREAEVEMDDLTARTVEETLKKEIPNLPRRVLEIRQALSKSSVKKYKAMIGMASDDSRIRGTLLYHGAVPTGRFAGRGIQPQNFARGQVKDVENIYHALESKDYEWFNTLFPDVFTALSSGLRGMLRAAPGNKLYCMDFAAIEARVILWLALDEKNLNVYREGIEDPYKIMASKIFTVPLSEVTKQQRELGKRAVLGCGYGMGAKKFKKTCYDNGGLVIDESLADKAVKAYRENYSSVKAFWYECELKACFAVKNPGIVIKAGHVKWGVQGDFLFCQLPNGRKLAYYKPEVKEVESPWGMKDELSFMSVDTKTKKWMREHTYGGKLAENLSQSVARDVMVDAMFRAEENNYNVILTVHDEIVSETKENFGSLDEFEHIIAQVPDWAEGLPIKVEGWDGIRYRK